jgi:hypothetical protein
MTWTRLVEAHRFFCRQSQHFVLGNWYCYVLWFEGWKFNTRKLKFLVQFPFAYCRFMYYSMETN